MDMASAEVVHEVEGGDDVQQLKHLEFLKNLTTNTSHLVSNLYDSAKENLGPLKSTVETVENVAGPIYEKFKDVPTELLVFLDNKVDEATHKFEERAPPAIAHASTVSKHFAVTKLASLWYKVNHNPALRGVSEVVVPAIAQLSEMYNKYVREMEGKGYRLFDFVPLVPVEEIVEAYEMINAGKGGDEKEDEGDSSRSETVEVLEEE